MSSFTRLLPAGNDHTGHIVLVGRFATQVLPLVQELDALRRLTLTELLLPGLLGDERLLNDVVEDLSISRSILHPLPLQRSVLRPLPLE